jgi:hypothetical protein
MLEKEKHNSGASKRNLAVVALSPAISAMNRGGIIGLNIMKP